MLPHASDIQYFLEVIKTKNISRAAERIGITQPALSQSVKRLENAFGQQLLLRGKGGVKLTRAGEKLAIKGKQLIDDWYKIKEEAKKDESEIRGSYSLGLHPSVALYTLSYFVPQLMKRFGNLEFKIHHDLSRKITEDIVSFKVDLGIVVNPFPHPDLVIIELFKDEVLFWRSNKKNELTSFEDETAVLIYEPDLNQSQAMVGKLNKKRFPFQRYITSSNLEVIKNLTLNGAGIGIIPRRVVGNEIKKMESLDKAFPKYSDRICLVYRHDFLKGLASKTLLAEIKVLLKNK